MEVSITIFAAFQISKGASYHQLNLLHLKYADQFEDAIFDLEKGAEFSSPKLEKAINNVKAPSVACLVKSSFIDRTVMEFIGTEYALVLCQVDIDTANTALAKLEAYSNKEISKVDLLKALRISLEEFHDHSDRFEEPISKTVDFLFKTMIPIIVLISLFNIIFITYLSRSITSSIRASIQLLSDKSLNPDVEMKVNKSISKELFELLTISRKRVKEDLLNIEKSEELKLIVERQTKELQSNLTRQNLALKASSVGVWELDLVSNDLVWDQRMYNLYGIEEKDFEGTYSAWEKAFHPEDRERCVLEFQDAIKKATKFDTEFRVVWPSGKAKNIKALADLIVDNDGNPQKMIGVSWDITEATEQKLKLESLNEELTQFAYRTSHDLKSPLVTVRGLSKVIQEDIEDGNYSEIKKNAATIGLQVSKLENLVVDILNLTRADLETLDVEKVDLEKLVSATKERLKDASVAKGVRIDMDLQHTHQLMFSKTRIDRILENLMSNSIKYCDQKKSDRYVKISSVDVGENVLLSVEDNGMGVPEKYQHRVFGMFERFHQNVQSGSGLGLYIVKKHVMKMGAEINFVSSPAGSKVEIKLNLDDSGRIV